MSTVVILRGYLLLSETSHSLRKQLLKSAYLCHSALFGFFRSWTFDYVLYDSKVDASIYLDRAICVPFLGFFLECL